MEYIKISELDTASNFGTDDHFVLVQNAETLKISASDMVNSFTTLTNLATRSFVTAIVDSAPETLDTLNELAAALNDDANFASTITNLIASKLDTSDFGLKFWEELSQVNTYHITEGSNLYWTQERFDAAFATKNTYHLEEGSNLYFTEQRVLDVVVPLIPTSFVTSYNDLTDKPIIPTDINQLTDSSNLLGQGGGDMSPDPIFNSVTVNDLNAQNITFTGVGAVTFESGNDLNLVAAGDITFNGETAITKSQLKSIVSASADFADFQARIAVL